ncbi:hypothetical protein [Geomicrobium sp. JCM 19055]|uniref:hypothetical protein n=1 Tax=Geomicrobium sp. JCM 19055 TaxID=1460649 RepID=UPI002235EA51|nr:hypothetical protein [Geomicrobium sp. JCM 19055]
MTEESKEPVDAVSRQVETARKVRKIVVIALISIVLLVAVVILSGYVYLQSAVSAMDEEDESTVEVEIPIGSSTMGIGQILEDEGLITNATFF